MFNLEMHFSRNLERQQESSDEGILQIAGITIVDGVVMVNPISIDLKQQLPFDYYDSWPTHLGTARNPVQIGSIDADNGYFGFVIRAIECDNSTDREGDLQRFVESIRQAAQRVVDDGRLPGVNTIWLGGNAAGLNDRLWFDDDDNIGVSARVYPNYGNVLARPNEVIDPPVSGSSIPGSTKNEELLFHREGASWRVRVNLYAKWI